MISVFSGASIPRNSEKGFLEVLWLDRWAVSHWPVIAQNVTDRQKRLSTLYIGDVFLVRSR